MSIEQRLRTGLSANTEHVQPDLDRGLALLLRRARGRRRARTAGFGLTAAGVAAAGAMWLPGVSDSIRTDDSAPVDRPNTTSALPPRLAEAPYDEPLQPGRYSVPFNGSAASVPHAVADLRAVIEVPAGFTHDRDTVLPWRANKQRAFPDEYRGVEFWIMTKVASNPCTGSSFLEPGPTVADLANALADQPLLRATDPVPTSLGGYDGLYLEVSVPANAAACEGGGPLWLTPNAEGGFTGPRAAFRFWILDVEGERLVVNLFHRTDDTENEVAELARIVESTTFTTIGRPVKTDAAPTPRPRWDRPLKPGRYTVVVEGSPAPRPVIDLPGEFFLDVGFGVFEKDPGGDGRRGVGFWNGERLKVDANFCDGGSPRDFQDPGSTVEDLANVLADQPGMRATKPVPVSLGGHDGLYVELELPANATECDDGALWITGDGPPYHDYLHPGVLDRFWILDVDGHRLVIEAHHTVEASSGDDVAELTHIVESTTFPNIEPSRG